MASGNNQEMVRLKAEAHTLLTDIRINLSRLHEFVDDVNNVGVLANIQNVIEVCETYASKVFALQPPVPPPENDEGDIPSTTISS